MKRLFVDLFFGLATILLSQSASAMTWTAFQECISSVGSSTYGYGSSCDLDYSSTPYEKPPELPVSMMGLSTCSYSTTLCVGRSNLTITGDQDPTTGNYPTILRCRDTSITGCTSDGVQAQLAIDPNGQCNITIEYLNFNGDYGDGTGGSPGGHPSVCDPTGTPNPPCNYWAEIWVDYGSSYVTVEYVVVNYATNEAVQLLGANEEVAHSQFNDGANVGVGSYVGSTGYGASSIVIWDNQFTSNYGSGVAASALGLNISSNTFTHNHWGQPDGSNGPELYVAPYTTQGATVWYNTVDGEYSTSDPGANIGIELDPPVTCVYGSYTCLTGNVVYNHGLEGDAFFYNEPTITVNGDYVYDNGSFTGTGALPYDFVIYGSELLSGSTDPNVSLISVTAYGAPTDEILVWGFNSTAIMGSTDVCNTNMSMTYTVQSSGSYSPYYTNSTCPTF